MKIITVSCIQNTPINSGGKTLSYYVNSTLAKKYHLEFYYFDNDGFQAGYTPKDFLFSSSYIASPLAKRFSFFPSFFRKLHLEFLFDSKSLTDLKCDIILLEFPYLYHIAKKISLYNNNCPIILLAHNIEWQYYKGIFSPLWRIVKIFEHRILNKIQNTLCVSSEDQFYLQRNFSKMRTFLFSPGVLDELFTPEGQVIESFSKDKKHILFYGRLDNPANKEGLQYIKSELCMHISDDWDIHILGTYGIDAAYFEGTRLINEGVVTNPYDYIRSADIILLPIRSSAGVKMRILESLFIHKVILCTPELALGVPHILKDCVIVCDTSFEFLQAVQKLQTDSQYFEKKQKYIQQKVALYKQDSQQHLQNIFLQFFS